MIATATGKVLVDGSSFAMRRDYRIPDVDCSAAVADFDLFTFDITGAWSQIRPIRWIQSVKLECLMANEPIRVGSIDLNQGIHWATAPITVLKALSDEFMVVGVENTSFASVRKEPQ